MYLPVVLWEGLSALRGVEFEHERQFQDRFISGERQVGVSHQLFI
jgi:hypothetical protein